MMYDIFRNVLPLKVPKNGWGKKPGVGDTATADDIERIRIYRNSVCHSNSSELTTEEFNELVLDLIGVRPQRNAQL